MPEVLNCPACGAPLRVEPGPAVAVRCIYCTSLISLQAVLLARDPEADKARDEHAAFLAHIEHAYRARDRIAALRAYRGYYGLGLKEAKEAVEMLFEGEFHPNHFPIRMHRTDSVPADGNPEVISQAAGLIQEGQKIQAIKVLREHFDLSLKLALDVANEIETRGDVDVEWMRQKAASQHQAAQAAQAAERADLPRFTAWQRRRFWRAVVLLLALFVIAGVWVWSLVSGF